MTPSKDHDLEAEEFIRRFLVHVLSAVRHLVTRLLGLGHAATLPTRALPSPEKSPPLLALSRYFESLSKHVCTRLVFSEG
jgi:hypothetical protein